jgi:transposase
LASGNWVGVNDWLEGRRLRVQELMEAGWRQIEVAEALGVTKGAVSEWVKRTREGGIEALRRHPGILFISQRVAE